MRNRLDLVATVPFLLLICACAGRTATSSSPTGPSYTSAASIGTAALSDVSGSLLIQGAIEPLVGETSPCFADRYNCEAYDFSLSKEGPIEVTLTWEGPPRALLVQLHWAGEGLAHEDVAPREGPSRIWFRRPLMEATNYSLRVVSFEPDSTIPFTLTLTY
jgi:hypothetical protein